MHAQVTSGILAHPNTFRKQTHRLSEPDSQGRGARNTAHHLELDILPDALDAIQKLSKEGITVYCIDEDTFKTLAITQEGSEARVRILLTHTQGKIEDIYEIEVQGGGESQDPPRRSLKSRSKS